MGRGLGPLLAGTGQRAGQGTDGAGRAAPGRRVVYASSESRERGRPGRVGSGAGSGWVLQLWLR